VNEEGGIGGVGRIIAHTSTPTSALLQISSKQVTPGFSGAPVFDQVTRRTVGMVTTIAEPDRYLRQQDTAFAVPSEVLRAVAPSLQIEDICPYRGLDIFTETDAKFYFGRRSLVARIGAKLAKGSRFLAFLGPSGSGKSSLIHAGLIPTLRQDEIPGLEASIIEVTRPPHSPLFTSFIPSFNLFGLEIKTTLAEVVRRKLADQPGKKHVVLLIDSFESLFVTYPPDLRNKAIEQLIGALEDPAVPFTLIVVMRDDFYSRFARESPALLERVEAGAVTNVGATLSETELREIIEGPAELVGLQFEPGLRNAIIADCAEVGSHTDGEGIYVRSTILPLLEFALARLWEKREDGFLTHSGFRKIGGVSGALARSANSALRAFPPVLQPLVKRVFLDLVHLGDKSQGLPDSRQRRPLSNLCRNQGEADETQRVVEQLVGARLLVTGRDEESGNETVELVHEALLTEWDTLRSWMNEHRELMLWRQRLAERLTEWEQQGRDNGALLRGLLLAEAVNRISHPHLNLTQAEREYIETSQRVESLDQQRWKDLYEDAQNNLAAALLGRAALVTLEKEQHRALVYLAEAERVSRAGSWPIRSIVIGAPVSKRAAIIEIDEPVSRICFHPRRNLLAALTPSGVAVLDPAGRGRPDWFRVGQYGTVDDIAFHSTTNRLLARHENRLIYWRLDDERTREAAIVGLDQQEYDLSGLQRGLAISGDERTLYFPSSGLRLLKLDAASFAVAGEVARTSDWIAALSLHPSEQHLAVATGNSTDYAVYSIRNTMAPPLVLEAASSFTTLERHVVFSPDGKFLVASMDRGVARVWHVEDDQGEGLRVAVHFDARTPETEIVAICVSSDASLLAIAHNDISVSVWDLTSTRLIARISGHRQPIESIAFTQDGRYLASGSADGTIQLWSIVPERDLGVNLSLGSPGLSFEQSSSVVFSGDGSKLALPAVEGGLWMHATEAIGPDARRKLAVGNMLDRPVTRGPILEEPMPGRVFDLSANLMIELEGPADGARYLQFAHDERYLLGCVSDDHCLVAWNMPEGTVAAKHQFEGVCPLALGIDHKGARLAVSLSDGSVEIAELRDANYDAVVRLCPDNGQKKRPAADELIFAAGHELLLAAGGEEGTLWDLRARAPHGLMRWSADRGERVVGHVGDLGFLVLENDDGKLVIRSTAEDEDRGMAVDNHAFRTGARTGIVSSIMRYCALAALDGTVKIWDSRTRSVTASLAPDIGRLSPMCFDPSGTILVTQAHYDVKDVTGYEPSGKLQFWDVETSQRIGELAIRTPASGWPLKAYGARLSGGHPHLVVWGRDGLFIKSGVTSAELKAAEEGSGYVLRGANLARLGSADPREVALTTRGVALDEAIASFWPAFWKLQRDLGRQVDPRSAAAPIRGWLQKNARHPFRVRVPSLVESLL
jgi:WD40 repeat protein